MTQGHLKLHVFAGTFASRDEACRFSEPQWEPEPDESVDDETYAEWEDRNPGWRLRDELGVGLDEDFIETHFGDDRATYLRRCLVDADDLHEISRSSPDANTYVLLFPGALRSSDASLHSTSCAIYCGAFAFRWA